MGYIKINTIDIGGATTDTQVTVAYKLTSAPDVPGSYTIYSSTVMVMPNDQIVGGPITISGLLDNTSYTVKITVNCSGASTQKNIVTSIDPAFTTTTTSTSTVAPPTTTTTSTSSTTTTTTTLAPPQIQWEYQELGGAEGTTTITSGPTGVENFQIFASGTNSGTFSIFIGNKLYIAVAAQSSTNVPNYYYIKVTNLTDNVVIYEFSSASPTNYLTPALAASKTYKVLTITNLVAVTTSTTTTSTTLATTSTTTSTTTNPTTSTTSSSTTTSSTTLATTTTTTTTTSTSTSTTSTTSSTTTSTTTLPCPTIEGFTTDGASPADTTTTTTSTSSTTTSTTTIFVTTTTTSTSSSTTTSTSTLSFLTLVRYGTLSDGDAPTEAEILAGSFINKDVSIDVSLNWGVTASVPTFYWFAIPNIHSNANKNYFFQAVDNQGSFSADGVFNTFTTVTVDGVSHFVWITNYATLFLNADYTFSKV